MTTRNCLARIIPARWFNRFALAGLALLLCVVAPAAAPGPRSAQRKSAVRQPAKPTPPAGYDLISLVHAWRSAPTPDRRAAVEAWAVSHPKDAISAQLALGIGAYEQKDFATAIARLQKLPAKLPAIADYVNYYLAAARVEAQDFASVQRDAAAVRLGEVISPLAAKSWLLEARALKTSQPADGARLLRDHYAALPQPEGDLTLGDCYQAAGDLANAAEFYQRVFYQYTSGDASARAAAALLTIKDSLGAAYPQPLGRQLLGRADRFLELRDYVHARSEYVAGLDRLTGLERDQARVRIGAADLRAGKGTLGETYLTSLELAEPAADAERLYYLEEAARQRKDDEGMTLHLSRLAEKYRLSPWRLKALTSAANRYLVVNQPEHYIPLYKAIYEDFPNDSGAPTSHWKVTFAAYVRGDSDAATLLRDHLRSYPAHATAGAALYFLGRLQEQQKDFAAARATYLRLAQAFQNYYYGVLASDRLRQTELSAVTPSARDAGFLLGLKLPVAAPLPQQTTPATTLRIARSRLLRIAGLSDLADSELRFGARTDGQSALLGMEIATSSDSPHIALHTMKSMSPEYLTMALDAAPRKFWELLYPLPYRDELMADAQRVGLDPFLVAGLIRQESEFDPNAVSPANALGLTQVRAVTGRQFAAKAGVPKFTPGSLFQPAVNLKIGTAILRSMLDHNGGRLEETLASYNAGPARAAQWLAWNNYREPAEFVESIPFTETRDYVQAVIRNAGLYRRLYQ
jgi:peptidoglycan lytic transglycosylase